MSQPAQEESVLLQRVPRLGWKTNTQSVFVGALSAALAVTDHPVSERELNGLTALAFRVRWLYYETTPKWCPSCPVGECPEEIAAVGRNVGWQLDCTMEGGKISPQRQREIVASIDRGMPVVVYDAKWNPAVAYGYDNGGAKLIVCDYFGGDGPQDVLSLPSFVLIVKQFVGAPDSKAAIVDALKMAIGNWHIDHKVNGPGAYWYGRAAYEHWISDVLHAEVKLDSSPAFPTRWNMDVLVDARCQAAHWLEDVATLFDAPAGAFLREASAVYAREHELLWEAWGVDDAFSGDASKWADTTYRMRMGDVLAQARDMETQAIAQIEQAVR